MTRINLRLSLVGLWLLIAAGLLIARAPVSPAGWLTWCVMGVAVPLALWRVTASTPLTMSEVIHKVRD